MPSHLSAGAKQLSFHAKAFLLAKKEYTLDKKMQMDNIKNQFILALLAYAAERDVRVEQLSALSGIDAKLITTKEAPTVTSTHETKLWLNAVHLTNDPLFGLHFGESLQLAALGIVGQVIQACSTVGEALQHACSLTHLVNEHIAIETIMLQKEFLIHFTRKEGNNQDVLKQITDLFMVFSLHELDGLLLKKIQPNSVTLNYTPENPTEYQRIFRCTKIKKSKTCSISFSNTYWNQPLLTADYVLQNFLLQRLKAVQEKQKSPLTWQGKIYNHLLANSYLGIPTLEAMAANLNMSTRSLQRKLQEEESSYQSIADAVRKTLAMFYLQSGSHAFKEISYLLGYNEPSAFTRAFKRWTGSSPASYQQAGYLHT